MGNQPVHIISPFLIWSRLYDRCGDPRHVTSPIWGPPPPCKQAYARVLIGREMCLHESMSTRVESRCFALRSLITQEQILKCFLVENSTILLYLPFPRRMKLENLYKHAVPIFSFSLKLKF